MTALPSPVLLTGATGFIGKRLHRHLLDLGVAVRVLVRARSVSGAGLDPRCQIVTGELTDSSAMARAVDGIGAAVYCAGAVRGRRARDFEVANVSGLATLLEALGRSGAAAPPLVLMSSLAASRPELSLYARSKHAGERLLDRADHVPWTILRPPAVYGPGDREMRPLLDLIRRGVALRPGPRGQRLALLHVDDLARAVAACLAASGPCRHRAFAIDDGHDQGYDWHEIAAAVTGRSVRVIGIPGWALRSLGRVNEFVAGFFGFAPMLTAGKARELQQPRWLCDNRAFTHATGWQPDIDLERGVAALFRGPAGPRSSSP
ncbi:MAG: NAD-dependent epimerase/dehydratase family protein [Pseudomonadales bacterium]